MVFQAAVESGQDLWDGWDGDRRGLFFDPVEGEGFLELIRDFLQFERIWMK